MHVMCNCPRVYCFGKKITICLSKILGRKCKISLLSCCVAVEWQHIRINVFRSQKGVASRPNNCNNNNACLKMEAPMGVLIFRYCYLGIVHCSFSRWQWKNLINVVKRSWKCKISCYEKSNQKSHGWNGVGSILGLFSNSSCFYFTCFGGLN